MKLRGDNGTMVAHISLGDAKFVLCLILFGAPVQLYVLSSVETIEKVPPLTLQVWNALLGQKNIEYCCCLPYSVYSPSMLKS